MQFGTITISLRTLTQKLYSEQISAVKKNRKNKRNKDKKPTFLPRFGAKTAGFWAVLVQFSREESTIAATQLSTKQAQPAEIITMAVIARQRPLAVLVFSRSMIVLPLSVCFLRWFIGCDRVAYSKAFGGALKQKSEAFFEG